MKFSWVHIFLGHPNRHDNPHAMQRGNTMQTSNLNNEGKGTQCMKNREIYI